MPINSPCKTDTAGCASDHSLRDDVKGSKRRAFGGDLKIASIEEQPIIDKIPARLKKQGALPPPAEWWPAARASPDSSGLA